MLCMYHDKLATFVLPHWHCGLGVTISLDWTTGLDYWTHPKWCKIFSSPFQCRREANHVYSAYFFAKFAPLACLANFTGVGRGQKSRAYLISFNEMIKSCFE